MRGGLCLYPRLWTGIQHKLTGGVAGKTGALTSGVTRMISAGAGGTGGGVKVSLHLPEVLKLSPQAHLALQHQGRAFHRQQVSLLRHILPGPLSGVFK